MTDRSPLDLFRFRQTEPGRFKVIGPRIYMESRGTRILWNLTHDPAEFRQFLRDRTGSDFESLQRYVLADHAEWSIGRDETPQGSLLTTVCFPRIDTICHNG